MKPEITDIPSACRYLLAALDHGFVPCQEVLRIVWLDTDKINRYGKTQYCSVGYLFTDAELDQLAQTEHQNLRHEPASCNTNGDTKELQENGLLPFDPVLLEFLDELMDINDGGWCVGDNKHYDDRLIAELKAFLRGQLRRYG